MIPPSIGRIVWHHPTYPHDRPQAAIVTYVWTDRMVNLTVFDANGQSRAETSVRLLQDGDAPTVIGERYCEWMPYQKGQAAKHDAAKA